MGLSEREIFDQMLMSLRGAIDDCVEIASQPRSGPQFERLRAKLKLVEGCCRQAAAWREDTRWLPIGITVEQAHQRARGWLHRPTVASKKLFLMLADNLRLLEKAVVGLQTKATGRKGIILPDMVSLGRRAGAPVQVPGGFVKNASGLVTPLRLQ